MLDALVPPLDLALLPRALDWRAKSFQQKISGKGKPTKEMDLHGMSRLA